MADNITIQYGPWAPDLQNIATEAQAGLIPCADVLNVYYQDGAYRCIPSPLPQGAPNSTQCLNAFTWYDNVASQEVIFEGTSAGINALIDGLQNTLGVETTVTVFGVGISAKLSIAGSQPGQGVKAAFTLGKGTVTGGALLNATLTPVARATGNNTVLGFIYGSLGSLSPTRDANGNQIIEIAQNIFLASGTFTYTFTFQMAGIFPSNYFSAVKFPKLGTTLATNIAGFNAGGGVSTWSWSNAPVGLQAGVATPVQMLL